jgi:hypothetical protein
MEFVNGRTLKEVLAQEQRLQPRRALEIIADICAALEFSHRHGIIHRDIKPGNVMITQNGQVKVMDFGIARALASGATTMTQTSAVIGTAQYLSPEQARGESVDARSDVYAAGCVLFELVIGHPPFVGDSPVSVAYQHVREEPRVPSSINREVPPDIDAIVLKALAKNPLNRYQSSQEMRADALRAVSGRPVMATPVMNQAETVAMQGGPRQWQPQGATTIQRPIPGAMGAPQKPESRSSWVMAVVAGLAVLVVVVLGVALAMSKKGDDNNTNTNTPQTFAMPKLEGLTPAEVEAELTRVGLTNAKPLPPDTKNDCDGTVVEQDPEVGTNVTATDPVTYKVCNAPDPVSVPNDLVGSPLSAAQSRLTSLGLEIKVERVNSSAEKDRVLKVEKAGSKVDPGTTITVTVSNNALVKVPPVEGKSLEAAQALLEAADLIADPQFVQADGEPGTVISQGTKSGKEVERNTTIKLTVIAEVDPNPSTSESTGTGEGGGNEVP